MQPAPTRNTPDAIPYFISAGEPSGDLLGAELVNALREQWPEAQPFGIAGPAMREAGVQPFAGIEDLSVMGFVEVLRHFYSLKMLENDLLARIDRLKPRFAVLIDYPGFHLRLAEQLKMRGIPVVQYVAPQLWAWGAKRTERLRRVTDHVLGIMPFETEFFHKRNVAFTYIGTPQVDRAEGARRRPAELGLPTTGRVIGFFPGSRRSEVSRTLPVMRDIMGALRQRQDGVHCAVSLAAHMDVGYFLAQWPELTEEHKRDIQKRLDSHGYAELAGQSLTIVRGQSLDLMASVDVALVTSGTATLECALTGTPLSVFYRMNQLSYLLAKNLVKLPHISLVNLVAGRGIVNEFIQDFNAEAVAKELLSLLLPGARREEAMADLRNLRANLQGQPGRHGARWLKDHFQ